ncbi:MAG: DUF6145 family protein [Eubacterium sp.]|nr:DUF6145 family protein [Eubacterium sp.]
MYQDEVVLCAASAYEEKYYFNEDFQGLPDQVKDELRIMCTLFTADVGGVLEMIFAEDGTLYFKTEAADTDFSYDEIGSVLKVKQYQAEKRDLLESLETYYKVFFLGLDYEEG